MKWIEWLKICQINNLRIALILVIGGCSSFNQFACLEIIEYELSIMAPVLNIISEDSNCVYNIHYDGYIDNTIVSSEGKLYLKNNAYFIKINDPATDYVKIFDLSEAVGESREVIFSEILDLKLRIQLEDIIETNEVGKVYVFQATDNFNYDGHILDVVYFVNEKNGVIGTYFSDIYDDREMIYAPKGNILEKYRDYSSSEFRKLN